MLITDTLFRLKYILLLLGLLLMFSHCRNNSSPKVTVIQYGPDKGTDTYIQNSLRYHDWTWGKQPVLISMTWTDDVNSSTKNDSRILINFSQLDNLYAKKIDSLKLTLYKVDDYAYILGGQYGNNANKVYCITQKWNQNSVNWDNQPGYDSTMAILIPTNNNYDSITINLTKLLPKMAEYREGIMIMQKNTMSWSSSVYCSSSDTIPSNRPKLTVYYR